MSALASDLASQDASASGSSSSSSSSRPTDGNCPSALIEAFSYALKTCSDATGITTALGIIQPTSEAHRELLCASTPCTDLYRLFRNNADENCTVGQFVELSPARVAQVVAVCSPKNETNAAAIETPAPAPTPSPIATAKASSHTGAIVGGVVGGVAALVVLMVLVLWWRRVQRAKTEDGCTSRSVSKQGDAYSTLPLTPSTEPSDAGPWTDPAITAMRIPLEKIKIGALLSQGAYGEVFRGTYNEQQVAVKKILPARRRVLAQIHAFLDEIKLTATLEHTCIVRFIGVAWDSLSDLSMVTEFMPGGDLRQLLAQYAREQHPTGFDYDKIKIAVHVAHALTYLHSLQPVLVHRDLKSRNILLTAELDAKLIDFGVSRARQEYTMTAGVGTSLWMAPEVMLGERYDEKADVFSFGVVLSELDTHAVPYSQFKEAGSGDRKMADMVAMQLVTQGQLSVHFTLEADHAVVKLARDCLQLDAASRPSSAELLHRIHTIWRAGGYA